MDGDSYHRAAIFLTEEGDRWSSAHRSGRAEQRRRAKRNPRSRCCRISWRARWRGGTGVGGVALKKPRATLEPAGRFTQKPAPAALGRVRAPDTASLGA